MASGSPTPDTPYASNYAEFLGAEWGTVLAACPRGMAKRVLVVDDQQYLRDVQVLLLKEAGYVATAISSGVEALARLSDLSPDLILLDMSMPVMDGRQFLAHLRDSDRWAMTPVILSSGHDIDEMEAMRAPIVEVLHKPFSDRALLERVRHMIGDAEA